MTIRAPLALLLLLLSLGACHPPVPTGDALELYTQGAAPTETLPVVVVMHGYGGSPERVVRLLDGLAVRARVIAPHGQLKVGQGWGWFARFWQTTSDELAPGIAGAAGDVLRIVDERTGGRMCGRLIVTGFSQGGFLSYAIAARAPSRVAAAFPIGGLLPPLLRPTAKPAGTLPRVDAFHGDADSAVDLRDDRAAHEAFVAAGYPGALHVYPGVEHAIAPEIARDVRAAIEQVIRDEGCAK